MGKSSSSADTSQKTVTETVQATAIDGVAFGLNRSEVKVEKGASLTVNVEPNVNNELVRDFAGQLANQQTLGLQSISSQISSLVSSFQGHSNQGSIALGGNPTGSSPDTKQASPNLTVILGGAAALATIVFLFSKR